MTKLFGLFKPSKTIGVGYLERWHLIPRNRWLNVYLHKFSGSDDDRAPHDHPWVSVSLLLAGSLLEDIYIGNCIVRRRLIFRLIPTIRRAKHSHMIVLREDCGPAWTLFITGPVVREWGFWCPKGWKHWSTMTDSKGNAIGGCE